LFRVLLQAARDDAAEVGGQFGLELVHRTRFVAQDARDRGDGCVPDERFLAGGHLVEQHTEREYVAAGVDQLPLGLLGRHVRGRADHPALGRRIEGHGLVSVIAVVLDEFGQPEVEDGDAPLLRNHDVGWLEIPMGDPAGVSRSESVGQGRGQIEQSVERKPPLGNQLPERLPLDDFHGKQDAARGFFDRVDRNDVRMIEGRDRPGFPLEARPALGVLCDVVGQDLQCDVTAQLGVACTVDFAHAALTEQAGDLVMGNRFADQCRLRNRGDAGD
jgi:hypothetical protein